MISPSARCRQAWNARRLEGIGQRSHALDADSLRVRRQRLQVIRIGRENRPPGLRHCDNQRVDRRTTSCPPTKQRCSSREAFWDPVDHVAGLEQLVFVRVSPGMPLKALDKNNGRNRSRPQTLLPEGKNQRRGRTGSLGQATDGSRIQNKQVLACLARCPLGDSLCKSFRSGPFTPTRLTNLGE